MLSSQSSIRSRSSTSGTHISPAVHNRQSHKVDGDEGINEENLATPSGSPSAIDEEHLESDPDDDDGPSPPESKRALGPTTLLVFLRSWILEIVSLVLSILSFLATTAVMGWSNSKPLSSWNANFSINTAVSILATISRTTLAFTMSACLSQQKWNIVKGKSERLEVFQKFEEASRGPWGGFLLMFRLKFRQFAAFGALATALFPAFDPFMQNAISFQSQQTNLTTSASSLAKVLRLDVGEPAYGVPWSTTWRPLDQVLPHPSWSANNQPDVGLSVAVIQGFSNLTQSRPTLPATCETGNCIWPSYSSLGVCSSCFDISSQIIRKRRLNLNNPSLYYRGSGLSGDSDSDDECVLATSASGLGNCCSVSPDGESVYDDLNNTIPTNLSGETVVYNMTYQLPSVGFTNQELAHLNTTRDIVMVVNATSEPGETFNYKNYTTLISAFTTMRAPDSYLQNQSTWNGTTPIGTECALFFCVNEYTVKTTNGTTDQAVNPLPFVRNPASFGNFTDPTFLNQSLQPFLPVTEDDVANATKAVKIWFANSALWRRGGPIFTMLEPLNFYDLQLIANPKSSDAEFFNISANTASSLIQYVLSWSIGQKPETNDNYEEDGGVPDTRPNDFLSQTVANAKHPPSNFIDMLYASPNISLTFANAAQTLSNYIQNIRGSGQRAPITSTTQIAVTYIRIQWLFVVLPTLVLLAGYLYVFFALWQTWQLKAPAWKEALVPLLSRGLDEEGQRLLQDAEESGRLRKFVRKSRIRLNATGNEVLSLTGGS